MSEVQVRDGEIDKHISIGSTIAWVRMLNFIYMGEGR